MLTLLLILLLVVVLAAILTGPRLYRGRTTVIERRRPGTIVEREYEL